MFAQVLSFAHKHGILAGGQYIPVQPGRRHRQNQPLYHGQKNVIRHKQVADSIDLTELRSIFNSIMYSIELKLGIKKIGLKNDYYYSIPDEEKYNITSDPISYDVGQLLEDVKFLKTIYEDKSMAMPLNLMHFAPIIGYLATQVDWYGGRPVNDRNSEK